MKGPEGREVRVQVFWVTVQGPEGFSMRMGNSLAGRRNLEAKNAEMRTRNERRV